MSRLEITAIIPVYNAENTIERALDSVNNQTKLPDEIVVVDDGSTDKTYEILNSYTSKVPLNLIKHSENKGQSAARNTGKKHSRGEIIALLDADDRWKEKKIEIQLEDFETSKHEISLANAEVYGFDGEFEKVQKHDFNENKKHNIKYIYLGKMRHATSTIMVEREAWNRVGGFNEELWIKDEDLFVMQVLSKSSICHLEQPLSEYYKMDGGLSVGKDNRNFRNELDAQIKFNELVKKIYPFLEQFEDQHFTRTVYHYSRLTKLTQEEKRKVDLKYLSFNQKLDWIWYRMNDILNSWLK